MLVGLGFEIERGRTAVGVHLEGYVNYVGPYEGNDVTDVGPLLSHIGSILGRLEAMRGHFWTLFFALKIM